MELKDLVAYLDEYLAVGETEDYPGAENGLQVEGGGEVGRVMTAVDASLASVRAAAGWGADMLIVHHGLLWGGPSRVVGRHKARLEPLIREDISLYSAHLPLDAHPEVGNNAVLARALGFTVTGRFGEFKGVEIGVYSDTDTPVASLADKLKALLGTEPGVLAFGPDKARRVGVVSGGGGKALAQAAGAGVDTIITGELDHNNYFDAEETGVNVLYAGHYLTETFGVRALGEDLEGRFGLESTFFDHPTGL